MYYFAIILTIISNVLYHIFQRVTPEKVHPTLALAVTYATSTLLCVMLIPLFPFTEGLIASLKKINWASFALAIAIVGLELGFLLAYRAGWIVSAGSLVSNAIVAMLLLPIGVLLFRERLLSINYLGIVVCIIGLVMVSWR